MHGILLSGGDDETKTLNVSILKLITNLYRYLIDQAGVLHKGNFFALNHNKIINQYVDDELNSKNGQNSKYKLSFNDIKTLMKKHQNAGNEDTNGQENEPLAKARNIKEWLHEMHRLYHMVIGDTLTLFHGGTDTTTAT